jgi:hypothetical protein
VTPQVLVELLLVCLGVPLGATWTDQALQSKRRRLDEERRWLDEERRWLDEERRWLDEERAAVHAIRRQWGRCPRCRAALSEWRSQPK